MKRIASMALTASVMALVFSNVAASAAPTAANPKPAAAPVKNPEAVKYVACVRQAYAAPEAALEMATAWRAGGGGVAAQHCVALALTALKKYEEAAKRLEEVAQDLQSGHGTFGLTGLDNAHLLPDVYGQAGNAWLMAGNLSRAYNTLSTALANVSPGSLQAVEYLIDRSRTLGEMHQYDKALADIEKARLLTPDRAEIYIYRAGILRALKRLDDAMNDLATALKLDPDNPDALVERGIVNRLSGDDKAARADWNVVIAKYPGSPEAEAAQGNLALLDKGAAIVPPLPTRP